MSWFGVATLSGSDDDEERYSMLDERSIPCIVVLSQRKVNLTHTYVVHKYTIPSVATDFTDYQMKNTEKGILQRNLVLLMITM